MKKFCLLFFLLGFILSDNFLQAQNVGIGTDSPTKGKLVVRGTAGAVSAMFGDTTFGISIENSWPGIGINSYYNNGRRSISHGFSGWMGMNPLGGQFQILTTADSAKVNDFVGLYSRLLIDKKGYIGIQGNTNPQTPLAFSNTPGNKIWLRGNNDSSHYGLGSQVGLLQMYCTDEGSDIAFGHGSSIKFFENMRVKGNGIVGIGANDPWKAKLVVRGTGGNGAVSAIFGDTTSGIAIENSHPGIGINSYYYLGRRSITHGYGGLMGMNPNTGTFHIMTSSDSVGVNEAMGLSYRLFINKQGNIGVQGVSNPFTPLSFANNTGNKISLYGSSVDNNYGFGIQPFLLQMYSAGVVDDIAFGYGSSTNFTENMRIKGDGRVGIGTNAPIYPLTLQKEGSGFVQKGANVEVGTATSATAGIIKTYSNHPLQLGTNNQVQLTLTQTGDLGIGYNLPHMKLHVRDIEQNVMLIDNSTDLDDNVNARMVFRTGIKYTGAIGTTGTGSISARLSFFTGATGAANSLTEKMSILDNGNVGIGTVTPSSKLEIKGKTKIAAQAGDNAALVLDGPVAITGSNKFIFTYSASGHLLGSKTIEIDHALCNNDPSALLMVTARTAVPPFYVSYDAATAHWRIYTSGQAISGLTTYSLKDCSDSCKPVQTLLANDNIFYSSDMFNIMVIKTQ